MTVLLSALLYECDAALLGGDLRSPEGRHDVLREPTELVGEFRGRQSFSPVDHEILKPGVPGFDRLYAIDDLGRGPAEPGLLLHAVTDRGDRSRRTGSAPGAALVVGIAHEAERREPLVALVMCRLDAADGFFLAAGEVQASAPDHVLAELFGPAVAGAGGVILAHDVVEDLLAVQVDHGLEAIARHHVDGPAAGDRHPNIDRQVLGPWHHRDVLQPIASVVDGRRTLEVLALEVEGLLVEALQQELKLLL